MEKVNINNAPAAALQQIKHVGKRRAQLIISGRPYKDIYELSALKGFGRKRLDDITAQDVAIT